MCGKIYPWNIHKWIPADLSFPEHYFPKSDLHLGENLAQGRRNF
jgi:hypothetical protein